MISIIVSSYKNDLFDLFCKNVEQTIGKIKYEIIKIHNPGVMGITKAYNIGAIKAKFPYLIFAHEDILFFTLDWGLIIIKTFESNSEIGLIGVAGTKYKAWLYSGWALVDSQSIINQIRPSNNSESYLDLITIKEEELNIKYETVVAIDGLFMATTKEIYNKCLFDESFDNFHCYDLDYSFKILQIKKIVVVSSNISISHLSFGSFNSSWFDSTMLFHKKWQNNLPKFTHEFLSQKSIYENELSAFKSLLPIFRSNKYGFKFILKQIYSRNFYKIIGMICWLKFQYFLFIRIIDIIWRRFIKKNNT